MNIYQTKSDIIKQLLKLGCFKKGNFTLKSGKKSNYYVDLRILVSYPQLLVSISNLIYKELEQYKGLICGLPYAGIPYSQTVSVLYSIPMILLRKEQKKHGTSKMIEGLYNINNELILIDDVLTSGQSIINSLEHLSNFNIKKIIVVVDRNEGGRELLENAGYKIISIFSINDFT